MRIVQEALTNVRRHSGARHARVELGVEREALYAEVRDDGRGFDPGLTRWAGVGRHSMRQRALGLGGEVELWSEPGRGTRVLCRVPLPTEDPPRTRFLIQKDEATYEKLQYSACRAGPPWGRGL